MEPSLYLTYDMCLMAILAQSFQNVNGYMLDYDGIKSIVLMHTVVYTKSAPV